MWVRIMILALVAGILTACRPSSETRGLPSWTNGVEDSPESVVREYCALDFRGVRLSSTMWREQARLVTWEDEPGWDRAFIVRRFKVELRSQNAREATVRVKYHVLGRMEGDDLIPAAKLEGVEFHLALSEKGWKIRAPVIPPHVSPRSLTQNVADLIQTDQRNKDFTRIPKLRKALDQLSNWADENKWR